MEASLTPSIRNPFSDPIRLSGMGILSAVAAGVFIPLMVAPWQAGALTPELMRTLIGRGARSELALLLLPIALGATVLILRLSPLARSLDRFGGVLEGWGEIRGNGKFARFFLRPFVGISGFIWDKSSGLRHQDWRSGIRVMLQAYVVGLFVFLAVTAVMILLVLITIGIAFAIISAFMGGSAGESVVTGTSRVVKSRRTRDWVGEKVEHFNESGERVGESRRQSDWLGEKVTHTSASGDVIGESREHSDWIGKKIDHYSATGEHVGQSRVHTDLIGEKVDHYSEAGEHVGESRHQSDLLGGHVAHEGRVPIEQVAGKDRRTDGDEDSGGG